MAAIDEIRVEVKRGVKTAAVPAIAVMAELYGNALPEQARAFEAILRDLQEYTRELFRQKDPELKAPTGSAFNNCNGKWSEYIFAVFAWNALVARNQADGNYNYIYVKLPNNKNDQTNWISLLVAGQIAELERFERNGDDPLVVGSGHGALKLCSSNPDAVILRYPKGETPDLPVDLNHPLSNISSTTMTNLDRVFSALRGKLDVQSNLVAFLSMKTSIRPDRRYQFVHEGDSVKAILMYLKNDDHLRLNVDHSFLKNKFFGISLSQITQADKDAMDTAMTACISSPGIDKLWSVDRLCSCPHPEDVITEISQFIPD